MAELSELETHVGYGLSSDSRCVEHNIHMVDSRSGVAMLASAKSHMHEYS